VVKLGSDDAALSLLAEVPVGSLLPAEDGVYSPASRLLRLLLLAVRLCTPCVRRSWVQG